MVGYVRRGELRWYYCFTVGRRDGCLGWWHGFAEVDGWLDGWRDECWNLAMLTSDTHSVCARGAFRRKSINLSWTLEQ